MKVEVLRTLDEMQTVEMEWQRLADQCGGRATSQPWWCMAWWGHLGSGAPLVITVRREGDLVALLPLHERRLAGVGLARFLGHGLGAVSEMLVAPGEARAAEEAWSVLLGNGPRHVDLSEYRVTGGGLEALRTVSPGTEVKASDTCPVAILDGTVEHFLARRPKGLRRSLRRSDERLAAEGHRHEVEVVTRSDRLADVLDEVVAVYDAAEAERARQHLFAHPWGGFTRAALYEAAARGRLRLFIGRIDGQPASCDVGFASADRLELWIGRYDPRYRAFSPGHLSMRAVVDRCISGSVGNIDLGLGDDKYKRLWCEGGYGTVNVTTASSAPVLVTVRAVLSARRWLRQTRQAQEVTSCEHESP